MRPNNRVAANSHKRDSSRTRIPWHARRAPNLRAECELSYLANQGRHKPSYAFVRLVNCRLAAFAALYPAQSEIEMVAFDA